MNRDPWLQNQIIEAWQQSIAEDYSKQRINSERSLQASVWSRLNDRLEPEWRMFIEPGMFVKAPDANDSALQAARFPDLVICDAQEVVAIIELKYRPRAAPKWRMDLLKFDAIFANRDRISITNDRYCGPATAAKSYGLAKDVLFVWAGVHLLSKDGTKAPCLKDHASEQLSHFFLELHAGTKHGHKPSVW